MSKNVCITRQLGSNGFTRSQDPIKEDMMSLEACVGTQLLPDSFLITTVKSLIQLKFLRFSHFPDTSQYSKYFDIILLTAQLDEKLHPKGELIKNHIFTH